MPEVKDVILQVLEANKPIAAKIHPAMERQEILDKAIEFTEYWLDKEMGSAIQEFYAKNGISI